MSADIEKLIDLFVAVKAQEKALSEQRAKLEAQIAQHLSRKDEGSETIAVGTKKVTIMRRINRTLDADKWLSIAHRVPEKLRPVKSKLVLDEPGLKWLRDHEPDIYKVCSDAVTAKPGKPAVTVK